MAKRKAARRPVVAEEAVVSELDIPSGVVALRVTLLLLAATVIPGLLGGLVLRGRPSDDGTEVPGVLASLGFGAVVGLGAFLLMLVPSLVAVLLTRARMANSKRFARLVVGSLYSLFTGSLLVTLFLVLGKDFGQGLSLIWPSLLLAGVIAVVLATWPTSIRR